VLINLYKLMKKYIIILILIQCKILVYSSSVDLLEAINRGILNCEVKGNSSSTHYERALKIKLENLGNESLTIKIANGLYLKSDDSSYQDFIITKEEFITLTPKQKVEKELYAMCVRASRNAPSDDNTFKVSGFANTQLREVAGFIEKNRLYIPESQYAIWAVSDKHSILDITGFDTTAARKLREEVARILNIPIPKYDYKNDPERDYYFIPLKSIGGEFEYKLSKPRSIHIAMFDINGILVRELFRNDHVETGYHYFDYQFDAQTYTDELYYIKLIVDGTVKVNLEVNTRK